MVVLAGPTHPRALVRPGDEEEVLTIPSLEEYDSLSNCRGCSMVGYSTEDTVQKSYRERLEGMRSRFSPDFNFDIGIQKALESNDLDALKTAPACRQLNPNEHRYDCWQDLTSSKVLRKT